MASQSLYRKWRSQTFSDLIGQEAVVRTLLNAVRDGRMAHAYLFCGPRGTGKTSTARLLAKAVNCANPHDGEPCNECISCREITSGRSPDVIEIDAASNTGVDSIRDLRTNVGLVGTGGRYKVYVVDEAHMLSPAAFNALLKTLEEPPAHVIFVLATTEAHKVLPTVVSRCQRFDFRRIAMRDIVSRLQHVAQGEGLDLEPAAADLLARAAQGGLRDALSLLDQAIAFCGSRIDLEHTRAMLGLADPGAIRRLIAHVAGQQPAEGLHLINQMATSGADLRQLNQQLTEEWRALMLARAGADVAQLMDRTDDEARLIASLASRFTLEELTACARVFARNETPARGLPVPQLTLEITFLECLAIRQHGGQPGAQPGASASVSASISASAAMPAKTTIGSVPPPTRTAQRPPSAPAPQPEPAAPAPIRLAPLPQPAQPATEAVEELDLDAIERGIAPPPVVASASPVDIPEELPGPAAAVREPVAEVYADDGQVEYFSLVQSKWELVKQVCKQKSRTVAALLHSARPIMLEPGDVPTIVLQADFQFHLDKLHEPASRTAVEWALEQVLESPVRIRLVLVNPNGAGGPGGSSAGGPTGPSGSPRSGGGASSFGAGPARGAPGGGQRNGNRSTPGNGTGDNSPNAQVEVPVATNVRQMPVGSHSANGRGRHVASGSRPNGNTYADATASHAAGTGYASATVTPFRPARADAQATQTLEDEVRADPIIQAIMRSTGAQLADIRSLDEDERD